MPLVHADLNSPRVPTCCGVSIRHISSKREMYTMLRYLAPDLLKERGVEHFDAWAANFAEAVTALELAPDGSGYRMHTRFARFINLPELLTMFRCFADAQTAE